MDKILTRDEIKEEDKWDVDMLYQTKEEFDKDYQQIQNMINELANYKDTFLKTKENFKQMLLLNEKTSRLLEKLYTYANLKSNENMDNPMYQELIGKASTLYQDYQEKLAYFEPMLLKEKEDTIKDYLQQEEIKQYTHTILDTMRYKGHSMSEEEQKVLSAFLKTLESGSNAASYLMDADMRFGNIIDENGKEVELTESNYGIYLRSKNKEVRKAAFMRMQEVFGSYKNTLTATLSGVVYESATSARWNHFASSLEATLYANDIPVKLYDNLITCVHEHLPLLYQYFDLKKQALDLDEFHLYDGYVNTVDTIHTKYPFEKGKKLVLEALSVLGEEYIEILKKAFEENWIDKYPNRGKTGGAYSSGCYDTKPYVLLNYTNTYDDVSTLAHELGHSMHSYFSVHNNDYANYSYPLFLAEIASTVNELLFSYYMEQHTDDKKEKQAILNERLDMFKATVFRQTMFAEFEQHMHHMADKQAILTAEQLSNDYYELNKLYFGKNVVVDDVIRYEWLRIPHFYRPFYVYQYATGLSIAAYIAKNILEQQEGFKEKYLTFLKAGGSNYPLETLKIIDVDLTDTKVFEEAMEMFKNTMEEYQKVSNR